MSRCSQRNHRWAENPPTSDTPCVRCGKLYGERAAAKPSPAPSSAPLLTLTEADLAVLAPSAPSDSSTPSASPSPSAAASSPASSPTSSLTWCGSAGGMLAQVFVAACEAAIERLGREPNSPDDDEVAKLGTALGAQLAVWFSDSELKPWQQAVIAAGTVGASMYVGSKKLPPADGARALPARGSAPAPAPSAPSAAATPVEKPKADAKVGAAPVPKGMFGGA